MFKKLSLFVFLFTFAFNSIVFAANFRCENLFQKYDQGSVHQYADYIDTLNEIHNNSFFKQNLIQVLDHSNDSGQSFALQARWQAFRLRSVLKSFAKLEHGDRYELENLSTKLLRLSFLMDSSVIRQLSHSDKLYFQSARKALLVDGLEQFFFENRPVSQSLKSKIFRAIMVPLKEEYLRWLMVPFKFPILDGAVMPVDLAMDVIWHGTEKTKDRIDLWMKSKIHGKAYWNVFSVWAWRGVLSAIFVGIPAYGTYVYFDMKERGEQQVATLFEPVIKVASELAKVDQRQKTDDKVLNQFLEDFRSDFNREPTADEMQFVLKLQRGQSENN